MHFLLVSIISTAVDQKNYILYSCHYLFNTITDRSFILTEDLSLPSRLVIKPKVAFKRKGPRSPRRGVITKNTLRLIRSLGSERSSVKIKDESKYMLTCMMSAGMRVH